jgi:dTDP-4-dehydrorhamnose reductase
MATLKTAAVIGANGQLGSDLAAALEGRFAVHRLTHADIEIGEEANCREALSSLRPDLVVNAAAFHNVPRCETEEAEAFRINALGPKHLAQLSEEIGFDLVHFSTDYVFDGVKQAPYEEGDLPNPLSVYGVTKLAGEHFARNYGSRSYVIRVAGIYGRVPSRAKGNSNFVTTMIRLAQEKPEVRVVEDEIVSPTSTEAIAQNLVPLLETGPYGLYHMACKGQCSWYAFARVIFDTLGLNAPLYPSKAADYPSPVRRPSYSALENAALTHLGINTMPKWDDALRAFLRLHFVK